MKYLHSQHCNNNFYYFSQLVRALWLVNLADRILPYGPLKFKAVFVAKMFRDLSPSVFLTFLASKSLKLSFTSKIVYWNLLTTYESLNNDFKLSRFAFEVLQKYEAVPRE